MVVGPGTSVIVPVRRDSITEGKDWTTLGTKGRKIRVRVLKTELGI